MVHPYTEMIFALLGPHWITEVANDVSVGIGYWVPTSQIFAGIQWVF